MMMTDIFGDEMDFSAVMEAQENGPALLLELDGFEGPLHLLLELARQQKVDLAQISILSLAEQYIGFINSARNLRMEVAADYLVMAAWLAYLKSRLILPHAAEQPVCEAEEMAGYLAFRLFRLEAMRRASDGLMALVQVGRNVHLHGQPAGLRTRNSPLYKVQLFDLLQAYGTLRSQSVKRSYRLDTPAIYGLEEARQRLLRAMQTLANDLDNWVDFMQLLPKVDDVDTSVPSRSIYASTFLAGLEYAKQGQCELRQKQAFAPLYVRKRTVRLKDE